MIRVDSVECQTTSMLIIRRLDVRSQAEHFGAILPTNVNCSDSVLLCGVIMCLESQCMARVRKYLITDFWFSDST